MKTKILALAGALALMVATTSAETTNVTFSANQNIPDADANGLALSGSVSGLIGPIQSVSVTLNITNGFNGDLFAYLTGPNGGFAVLLNRVGASNNPSAFGYGNAGFNLTLTDLANDIHFYQNFSPIFNGGGQLTGTWQPDGRNIDPQTNAPSAFLLASPTATLASFIGTDPNGLWTLFLADLSSGSTAKVVDWGLAITVPEPSAVTLTLGGLVLFFATRKFRPSRSA